MNALRDLLQCAQEERDALSTKCEDLSARLSEVESSKSELVEEHDCLTLEVEELRAKLDQSEDVLYMELVRVGQLFYNHISCYIQHGQLLYCHKILYYCNYWLVSCTSNVSIL